MYQYVWLVVVQLYYVARQHLRQLDALRVTSLSLFHVASENPVSDVYERQFLVKFRRTGCR
jgi:hypothetical protein